MLLLLFNTKYTNYMQLHIKHKNTFILYAIAYKIKVSYL